LAESDAVMPPDGAGIERVRVHGEDAPASSVVASHANAEASTGAIRPKITVWEALFSVAVMMAHWVVVREPPVAAKATEMAFAAVTEIGTVGRELLPDRVTTLPPYGAA